MNILPVSVKQHEAAILVPGGNINFLLLQQLVQ